MTRIAFIGAGAVGGYFGGLMSSFYLNSKEVEIYFVCREHTARLIKEVGLNLETTHGDYKIVPNLFEEESYANLVFDFVICCTKTFNLLESLIPLKQHIKKETIVIPLLNGVDSYDQIKSVYPDVEVWDACVYIVSQVIGPGHIKETGGIQLLYFGSRDQYSEKLMLFENILVNAGLTAKYSENILCVIWEKFLFISSIATITSYLDKRIGEILSNMDYKSIFQSLLEELKILADSKKIALPEEVFNSIYSKMQKLPFEATSSMHRDFRNGNQTELETLTGAVVRMGRELGIELPVYEKQYLELKAKMRGL